VGEEGEEKVFKGVKEKSGPSPFERKKKTMFVRQKKGRGRLKVSQGA